MSRVPPLSTDQQQQHPSDQEAEQLVMGISEMVLQSPTEKKSSKLSAEAPEFVPRSKTTSTAIRAPIASSTTSNAAVAASTNHQPFVGVDDGSVAATPPNPTVQPEDISRYLLSDIRMYVAHLQTSPASFNDNAVVILDLLIIYAYNDELLSAAVDLIFSSGLEDVNFTYQCARLCAYLAANYWGYGGNCAPPGPMGVPQQPTETFQHLLIKRCQQEHQKRVAGPLPCLYNYGLLLADLYNQLQVGNKNLVALGDAVLEAVVALLSEPNNGNVAGAVSILKCCGATLEREERAESGNNNGQSPKLDAIFAKFESLLSPESASAANEYGLSEDGKTLIRNLLKNRADWKQYPTAGAGDGGSSQTQQGSFVERVSGDMVYFGPDGMELTAEETAFLERELAGSGDDDASFAASLDGPEDDAIDEAYEEFLRMTEEKRKQQNLPK